MKYKVTIYTIFNNEISHTEDLARFLREGDANQWAELMRNRYSEISGGDSVRIVVSKSNKVIYIAK